MRSAKAKRDFFSGIKFSVRIDTVELRLHSNLRDIVKFNEVYPNLHLIIQNICLKMGFQNQDAVVQTTLKEIALIDYYRSENTRSAVAFAHKELNVTNAENDQD